MVAIVWPFFAEPCRQETCRSLFMIGEAVHAGGWFGVYTSNWLVQRLVYWPGIVIGDSSQLVLIPVTAQGRRMVR